MPKVSIVMPVYNGEAYINEAIDSIIAQTFTDWEFIIVNEYGSNEAVTSILHDYEKRDRRIRVIQNETRLRIAESLNVGLRAATGEYIARMDADDIAGVNRLQKQVEYLDNNPDIGFLGICPTVFGAENWEWNTEFDTDKIYADSLFFLPSLHPTVMLRKSVLDEFHLEYDPTCYYTEDYEFFCRVLTHTKAMNLDDKSLFYYRTHAQAATHANVSEGNRIYKMVTDRNLKELGLELSEEDVSLLYLHEGCKNMTGDVLTQNITKLDLLMKQILQQNMKLNKYETSALFYTMHKRWLHLWMCDILPSYQGKVPEKIKKHYERSIFFQDSLSVNFEVPEGFEPKVTVLMPVHNGEKYLYEAIRSIQNQTFKNWEILIVDDKSSDNTVMIVHQFQKYDKRIRMIHNEQNLKIARTLNRGIGEAKGVYIARMDDDDISMPTRLEKEVAILDHYPNVAVVGSWQQHFGTSDWVHQPPEKPAEMKATLLFACDVCHSTIMFKKDIFENNNFYYNPEFLSEDYELWTRVSKKYDFYTIQEILGEYRLNGENITAGKTEKFDHEARKITCAQLKENLGIVLEEKDQILVAKWTNPFVNAPELERTELLQREEALLNKIEEKNKSVGYYDQSALTKVLNDRRQWAGLQFDKKLAEESQKRMRQFENQTKKNVVKQILKKVLKKFYAPFRYRYENRLISIQESVWRHDGLLKELLKTLYDTDGHLYDYYKKLEEKIEKQDTCISQLQASLVSMTEEMRKVSEVLSAQLTASEKEMTRHMDQAQEIICATTDVRVQKAEQLINETTDTRVWKAEQLINETTDARVWKAEQLINETTDARVWKAEQLINETTDARVWKAESSIKDMSRMYSEDMYKIQKALCPSACEQVEILFANDTWNTYHHGSSATSSAILKALKETGKKVDVLPMPLLCENVQVFPRTVLDFESNEFFEIWLQRNPRLVDYIEKSKIIVINGEGCITQYCAGTLNLLYFAYIASKRFGKKCSIINHSLCVRNGMRTETEQDAVLNETHFREIIRLVYSEIHFAALREKTSLKVLREILPGAGELSFDCISLYIHDSYIPTRSETRYITVSGGNALTDQDIDNLAAAVAELQSRFPDAKPCFLFSDVDMADATKDRDTYRLLQEKCNLNIEFLAVRTTKEWLDCIFNSEAVITGRFHHSIAAYMLNRPFVAISPDIHKLQSALDMMECSENIVPNDLATDKFLDWVSGICESAKQKYPEKVKEHLLELASNNFKGALK